MGTIHNPLTGRTTASPFRVIPGGAGEESQLEVERKVRHRRKQAIKYGVSIIVVYLAATWLLGGSEEPVAEGEPATMRAIAADSSPNFLEVEGDTTAAVTSDTLPEVEEPKEVGFISSIFCRGLKVPAFCD